MKRCGFSLAEAILSCGLIAAVLVVSSVFFRLGVESSRTGQLQADAQREAVRVAAKLTRDFQWSRLAQTSCFDLAGNAADKQLLLAVCTAQKAEGQVSLDAFLQRPFWQGFRLVWREGTDLKELYRAFPKPVQEPSDYLMGDFASDRLSPDVRSISHNCRAFWLSDQLQGPPSLIPQNPLYLNLSLAEERSHLVLQYGFKVGLDDP